MAFDGDRRNLPIRITTSLNAQLDIVSAIKIESELTRRAQFQSSDRNDAKAEVVHLFSDRMQAAIVFPLLYTGLEVRWNRRLARDGSALSGPEKEDGRESENEVLTDGKKVHPRPLRTIHG